MNVVARAASGDSGLAAAFAFLISGAVAVAFAFSAGLYLAAKGDGVSSIVTGLLLFAPLVAGVVHSGVAAWALRRASASKPQSTRTLTLAVAGLYCLVQIASLAGCVWLAVVLGV